MFNSKTLGGLVLAAGVWSIASASAAATSLDSHDMTLGRQIAPPAAFLDFCQRRPADCGADPQAVLAQARRSLRRGLFRRASQPATAAVAPAIALAPHRASGGAPTILNAPTRIGRHGAALAMSVELWSLLKETNDRVNSAIVSREDRQAYGVEDFWAAPLQEGRTDGDCEDFVLEKRRALLEAGLDPASLNIAIAVTPWGETHAVLLVGTSQGEYVLDNLSTWIKRWDRTGYDWRERQLAGEAFRWARVKGSA